MRPARCRTSLVVLAGISITLSCIIDAGAADGTRVQYAVSTANRYASEAGMQVLAQGGTAADAAVAIQMVLGLVEPQSSGLGGGAIVLYRDERDRSVHAFDGLAKSPTNYDSKSRSLSAFSHSGAAVGVPGALRLFEVIHRKYGKLPWATLFNRALELADGGFVVSPYLARSLASAAHAGMPVPHWFVGSDGKIVAEGALVRNTQLADQLRKIAHDGAEAFYRDSAVTLVEAVQHAKVPGTLAIEDFTKYQAAERSPICLNLRENRLCSFPPPSYGGVTMLELLGILENIDKNSGAFSSTQFVHDFAEAGRLAEADRMLFVGDPEKGSIEVNGFLDPGYMKARASLVKPDSSLKGRVANGLPKGISQPSCTSSEVPSLPSTSQVSIVDSYGNALAMTTTINTNFGSWIAVSGFFLNNAMTNFALPEDGSCLANSPAGEKRPETAMAPVIGMELNGDPTLVGGSAGGPEIIDYVAQAIVELLAGRNPSEALAEGHVSSGKAPYPDSAGLIELEEGKPIAELAEPLASIGQNVKVVPLSSGMGFLVKRRGRWEGAADPRRDGTFSSSN